MGKSVVLLIFSGIIFYAAVAGRGDNIENKGAETILLSGGEKMRDVHFPHHRHQNALGDCNICHDLFPKKVGGIDELKNQGKLQKKQVMQEHCIDCHKKNESGRPAHGTNLVCKMPQKNRLTGKR